LNHPLALVRGSVDQLCYLPFSYICFRH
jgi:hypothetical protein